MSFFRGKFDKSCFLNGEQLNDQPCVTSGSGRRCEGGAVCLDSTGVNGGITSFNHIGVAMLTVFQVWVGRSAAPRARQFLK